MGLFTPAWKSENEKRALKAVAKMTNQRKLARAAKDALHCSVRQAAVEKLTNQALLADVAKNAKDDNRGWGVTLSDVRQAAVEKLTDQTLLADVAKNAKNTDTSWRRTGSDVCQAAVRKLTDPILLADVAKYAEDNYARKSAVEKLTDPTVLACIARNDINYLVRKTATVELIGPVEKCTDPAVLVDAAKNDGSVTVRKEAIVNLIKYGHLKEALDSIYCFKYDTKEQINLASLLIDLAAKSDRPLKVQWKEIKNWIEWIPVIPHNDSDFSDCHDDVAAKHAPSFPPYPIES
jgi:hypothetical protein